MAKDWTGNTKSSFVTLGASNHSEEERAENDFYATDPNSLEMFLDALGRDGVKLNKYIWECACGMGHLSKVLKTRGYDVLSSDLIDRGYGMGGINFLESINWGLKMDILTNPPYKYAKEFVEHSLNMLENGYHCVMFLKIQFLEGKDRRKLFDEYPPKYVYVNSSRQLCYPNGDLSKKISSATCYCWFIWEKGFDGEPTIRWI